jgi:hypothetical protein
MQTLHLRWVSMLHSINQKMMIWWWSLLTRLQLRTGLRARIVRVRSLRSSATVTLSTKIKSMSQSIHSHLRYFYSPRLQCTQEKVMRGGLPLMTLLLSKLSHMRTWGREWRANLASYFWLSDLSEIKNLRSNAHRKKYRIAIWAS